LSLADTQASAREMSQCRKLRSSNIEVAHHLSEHEEQREYRMPQAVEIAEAIVLAVVAITTAWSGSNP